MKTREQKSLVVRAAADPKHDRRGFSCGFPDLDTYIRERAGQDAKRHVAATFVLPDDTLVVLGYCTLSQQIVSLDRLFSRDAYSPNLGPTPPFNSCLVAAAIPLL